MCISQISQRPIAGISQSPHEQLDTYPVDPVRTYILVTQERQGLFARDNLDGFVNVIMQLQDKGHTEAFFQY